MSLFDRAAIFTDIHFGEHQDSEVHNQDCLDFLEWFGQQTIENGCDTIIFMGDWFHNRVRTENRTAYYSRMAVELLHGLDLPVYWIVGNHEIYLKDSRDIHSLQYLTKYPNFHLLNTVTQIDDVVFSPWLVGDEHRDLLRRKCRYIFGHFELPFFLMNQVIEKTYDGKGLHIDDFENCEAVYSGHFHKRQVRLNALEIPIYYTGNCFGHNFNDVNDPERGMAVLNWGETLPEYTAWPDAPTYHRFQMSEFVQGLETNAPILYGARSTIELIDDLDLNNETMTDLREMIKARHVRFRKTVNKALILEPAEHVAYNSIDDMIEHKLKSMNYDGKFDPDVLVNLYREV